MTWKSLAFIVFLSIAANHQICKAQNNGINFARIINYNVIVKDISKISQNLYYNDSTTLMDDITGQKATQYIDQISFNQFAAVIQKYLNDKNALAVLYGKKVKMEELRNRAYNCDTLEMVDIDPEGNEKYIKKYVCDYNYIHLYVKRINFTESWYIDPKTYEFKKEVLAFTLMVWDYDKEVWRSLLTIYKNEAALNKINTLSNNQL